LLPVKQSQTGFFNPSQGVFVMAKKEVKIVVESENRVSLLFPDGTDLQVKKFVSVDELAKVLRQPAGEVEGQRCSLTAIGAVRG
jgi:hypothetical protein